MSRLLIIHGDPIAVLEGLPLEIDCAIANVSSWQGPRQSGDYGCVAEYIGYLRSVFYRLYKKMSRRGVCWMRISDSHCGPPKGIRVAGRETVHRKSLYLLPERLAPLLVKQGWVVRQRIIWEQVNSRSRDTRDKPRTNYELIYLLGRSAKLHYNAQELFTVTNRNDSGSIWPVPIHFLDNRALLAPKMVVSMVKSVCVKEKRVPTFASVFYDGGATLAAADTLGCHGLAMVTDSEDCELTRKRVVELTGREPEILDGSAIRTLALEEEE